MAPNVPARRARRKVFRILASGGRGRLSTKYQLWTSYPTDGRRKQCLPNARLLHHSASCVLFMPRFSSPPSPPVAPAGKHAEYPSTTRPATMKKHRYSSSLALAVILFLASSVTKAETTKIYADDFNGEAGTPLSGRAPDMANATGDTYVASAELELDGDGNAVTTSGGGVASIALPTINDGDVITITAEVRPVSNTDPGNWIGFGFSPDANKGLWDRGAAWVLLRGGPTNKRQGLLNVSSGPGIEAERIYTSPAQEPDWGGLDATPLTLTYAVKTGRLTATIGVHTVFDDIISYGGVAQTPVPMSELQNVILQWHRQGTPDAPPAGWIESFSVSIAKGDTATP